MHVACRTWVIFIQVSHDIWAYCMFKQLTWHTCEGHRVIITCKSPIPISFLKRGQMFARSHSFGVGKKCANTGPSSFASSFRTLGWSSLGPKAFEGFKPLSNSIIPSVDTTILSMKGADLLVNGTSLYSVLLNTSLNCSVSSSALSESNSAIPPLFLRGGIPCPSFFFWLFM